MPSANAARTPTTPDGVLGSRLTAACHAVESAGAALLALRGRDIEGREDAGDQLKTAVDAAAEGWVRGYLEARYPGERFLCEEAFTRSAAAWQPASEFWTIDALDGTRSFVEGFPGFCVQVAYVAAGRPRLGVVHEPVAGVTYWAIAGGGAFRRTRHGVDEAIRVNRRDQWPDAPVFVDSTPPRGAVGALLVRRRGSLLVCGSIGLKICRVAEGSADVFAKALTFRLWDTTPGEVILREAGGRLGLWCGAEVSTGGARVEFQNLVTAPAPLFELAVRDLSTWAAADEVIDGASR